MCPANNPTTASPARSAEVQACIDWFKSPDEGNLGWGAHQKRAAVLESYIASLEASQPKANSVTITETLERVGLNMEPNFCPSCGFHGGASHDWKQCEKSRLELFSLTSPKPQSEVGLREALEKTRAELKKACEMPQREAEWAVGRAREIVDAALSRQAPVPPGSLADLEKAFWKGLRTSDNLRDVLQLAYCKGQRDAAVSTAPVPTSGAVEAAQQIWKLLEGKTPMVKMRNLWCGEFNTKTAAIIQQAMDGATALLRQVSAEVCSDCGWAMKFPNEACRKCVADKIEGQPPAADGKLEALKETWKEARSYINKDNEGRCEMDEALKDIGPMKIWVYQHGHQVRLFTTPEKAEAWFDENDPEGVAFEYDVNEWPGRLAQPASGGETS